MVVYFAALLMCSHLSAFRIAGNIRKALMSHIAEIPLGFIGEMGSGKIRRIVNDSSAATETYLAHQLPDMAAAITTPICMVVMLFLFDWRFGLVSLLPILLGFASIFKMTGPKMAEDMKSYMDALADMNNEAVEYVRGVPVVKTFGQTVHSFKRFKDTIDNYYKYCIGYCKKCRPPMLAYTVFINSAFAFLIVLALILSGGGPVAQPILLNFCFYVIFTPIIVTAMSKVMYMSENGMIVADALSREGAKGLVQATAACTVADLVLMFPVGLLYLLVSEFFSSGQPSDRYGFYGLGIAAALVLIWLSEFWKYNATYFSTYRESGACRIRLAEKLRQLPLSFFGKKDLADLTNTIMGDVQTTEQMFSHYVPQFYGSIISTCLVAISLLCYDWQMALAALWVLTVALVIVGLSKKAQNYFTRKQNAALIAVADGVQECLETIRDLKSSKAEQAYLEGLNKKIDVLEGRAIKSELGAAMFVVPAQMVLKLGMASVALAGSMRLISGELSLVTFFLFLLVVSRIYEPMNFALQNLAAMNSMQVNIDRMNEINDCQEQSGGTVFAPKGYDITFDHVGFAYNSGETVLKDVSFTARQGEVTALIGSSGGGKSTAAKLAARPDCLQAKPGTSAFLLW